MFLQRRVFLQCISRHAGADSGIVGRKVPSEVIELCGVRSTINRELGLFSEPGLIYCCFGGCIILCR